MPRWVAVLTVAVVTCGLAVGIAFTQAPDWNKGTTDEKIRRLSDIQPGLGTVMMEYGSRFGSAYYAAKGGNYDLAVYMIGEMKEIQEVGENTRPGRASLLKAFESNYLDKLEAAAKAKNFSQYQSLMQGTINACNQCHVKADHGYIVYQLPPAPAAPVKMTK